MYWHHYTKNALPKGLLSSLAKKQSELQKQILLTPLPHKIKTVSGCDSSFLEDFIFSVFVVFEYPTLDEIEVQYALSPITMPYVPGYLSFREVPNILNAYKKLHTKPDIIIVDGQGIMHPRRLGIATHLGIVLNTPTIGVAKSKLTGTFEPVGPHTGDVSPVYDTEEQLGVVLRSKENVLPLFISPGHKCDSTSALAFTKTLLKGYKLPEPTRIADKYSKSLKQTVGKRLLNQMRDNEDNNQ